MAGAHDQAQAYGLNAGICLPRISIILLTGTGGLTPHFAVDSVSRGEDGDLALAGT
jgi:hypothetical protein